jgi:hypothetical protein
LCDAVSRQAGAALEQSTKSINQSGNKLHQLVKRWNHRLILKRLPFAEEYINGRLVIAFVVLSSTGIDGGSRAAGQHQHCASGEVVRTIFVVNAKNASFCHNSDNDQEPVFVGSIEVIHRDQKVASTVRAFIVSDNYREIGGESLYFSVLRLTYQRLPVLIYREGGFFRVCSRGEVNCSSNVVQGAAKIVDCVSDHAGQILGGQPPEGRIFYANTAAAAILSCVKISTDLDGVYVSLSVGLQPSFYIEDVMVGPLDL